MKVFTCLIFFTLASVLSAVDFIRQIQLIHGQPVVYDLPVSGVQGEILTKPLDAEGAILQLYAFHDETYDRFSLLDAGVGSLAHVNVSLDSQLVDVSLLGIHLNVILGGNGDYQPLPQLVDEITVGAHFPVASMTLSSADPYQPPRTRADQPYAMHLAVRKLAEPADPLGGISSVTLDRSFKFYHPELHVPYPNGSGQGQYDDAFVISRNGNFTTPQIYQALPAQRPTKACGEETFTARVDIGNGHTAALASSTIQIWPVCEAVIEGVEPGKRYVGVPEGARVVCRDLYPDSVTYAQIYRGPAALGTIGRVIGSSVVSFHTYAPQDAVVPLVVTDEELEEDGIYTIEVLTVTPFDDRRPERVAHVSFEIRRSIKIRSTLGSIEN